MAIPLIPWEPHVFPQEIQEELNRRALNRGLNYKNIDSSTWSSDGDWNEYRGPMTTWIRVCSNGAGLDELNKPGFVLYGGKDFYSVYGFNNGEISGGSNDSIIGYTPHGVPHIIENDLVNSDYPIHVPTPEIEKFSATIQKEILRRVTIEWTCYSSKQLEYMTPYFLVPGISVVIEWGWNHFNPLSLIDLTNDNNLAELYNNPYPLYTNNILQSKGNYEVLFGLITNFEWSIEGTKIRCKTEVTSKDRLLAGQMVKANTIDVETQLNKEKNNSPSSIPDLKPKDSLQQFIEVNINKFKQFANRGDKSMDVVINEITHNTDNFELAQFVRYIKKQHPDNYKEYLFGVFSGRDEISSTQTVQRTISSNLNLHYENATYTIKQIGGPYANKDDDFDCQSPRKDFWINLGLLIEIINFKNSNLRGVNDKSLFRVDVDDCVINAHPNLISSCGKILLIPNSKAPKYFYGNFGYQKIKSDHIDEYQTKMKSSTYSLDIKNVRNSIDNNKKTNTKVSGVDYANDRLFRICFPLGAKVYRDDLNFIINSNRIELKSDRYDFSFPLSKDFYDSTDGGDARIYKENYTGFFKDLYFNTQELVNIIKNDSVKTYDDLYKEIFSSINKATSDFWKFKLTAGTGRKSTTGLASMKVIDENMGQYTSNEGEIFTFDYYGADGLLQSINFRPQLSNAQAIRTIYAQINNDNKKSVLSDQNQLLDYKFRDKLFSTNSKMEDTSGNYTSDEGFKEMMARIQALKPLEDAFQVTIKTDKGPTIFRLAIPENSSELLTMLLDDGDKEYNPRYTGIMPNIQAEFTIQGLAGLRTFGMFRVRGLPEPYSENNIVFRIVNLNDSVQNGQWTTTIVAGVIPLRGWLRSKLSLSDKAAAK